MNETNTTPPEGFAASILIDTGEVRTVNLSWLAIVGRVILGLCEGVGVAVGAIVIYTCLGSWYHGGALDPRCVYGRPGYAEVHSWREHVEQVSCEYRPDWTRRP